MTTRTNNGRKPNKGKHMQRILIDRHGDLPAVTLPVGAKVLVIPCGGCGSGKSSVTRRLFPDFAVSDADSHRETHPDYTPDDPAGPGGSVHRWAVEQSLTEALGWIAQGRERMIYDTTGGTVERVALVVSAAKAAGYLVILVRVVTPRADAWQRNQQRTRTVPLPAFHKTHDKVNRVTPRLYPLADVRIVVSSANR